MLAVKTDSEKGGEGMELTLQVPKHAQEILEQLNNHGFEAYVVGGCVRDSLLHRVPGDWDITTSARPEQVKAIFGHTIDTGLQHGTVTIMRDKVGYEVTTYRIDGEYEDGRHPKEVEFTSNLLEDLKRRDFTINAMAYNPKEGLVDAFEGIQDLKEKRIRCVGNALERFTEDALRILRAIRFSAQLGFSIEESTWEAIKVIAPNLIHVSKERIQVELTKLLLSNHPDEIRKVFDRELDTRICADFPKINPVQIAIDPGLPKEKHMRWAALLRHQALEEAVAILRQLKLDNDTISKAKTLVQWWKRPIGADQTQIRKTMSQMAPELYDDLLILKASVGELELQAEGCVEDLDWVKAQSGEIRQRGDCVSLKELAVTGADLIQAGMKPGKELGETLKRLLELVLEHPEWNTKEILKKV